MKKSVFIILILIVLVVFISWLLPAGYRSTELTIVQRPLAPVERMMIRQELWKKWWPGHQPADSVFDFYGMPLTAKTNLVNGFTLVSSNGHPFELQCTWLPNEMNTVRLTITAVEKAGSNPFKKIGTYFNMFSTRKKLAEWITQVKSNLENDKNVYGFTIKKTKVKDPYLISTKQTYDHFPETNEIYSLIGKLESYISSQKGKAINHPIMHVHSLTDSSYEAMVAIATDTLLPPMGALVPKSMVLGFILEGEVTGGALSAWEAEKMIEHYAIDYRKASPAISFQRLITNRLDEPDTTKWVTRLYYPVFD